MIFKLSRRNFDAHFLDYFVYFVVMVFAVSIYYCFSAITYNQQLVNRAGQNIHVTNAMNIGGLIIIFILLFFMLSANRFFLVRRKTEIGVYRLAGMKKNQVMSLFLMEIWLIGLFSLVLGILFGIILSKLFAMILVKVMFLTIEVSMQLSLIAIGQTAGIFLFSLIIVSLRTGTLIYPLSLNRLLRLSSDKMRPVEDHNKKRVVLGFLGIVLIVGGYLIAGNIVVFSGILTRSSLGILTFAVSPFIVFIFCLVGTILFFKYTMYLFVAIFVKQRKKYFKDLTMVAVGNVQRQIEKMGTTLAAITVFIAITLAGIGGTAMIYTLGMERIDLSAPTDFIVAEESYDELKHEIESDNETTVDYSVDLHYKLVGAGVYFKVGSQQQMTVTPINFFSQSNYREYQKVNPYLPDVQQLSESEAVFFDDAENILRGFINYTSPVVLENQVNLTILEVKNSYFGDGTLTFDLPIVVISDERFQKLKQAYSYQLTAIDVTSPHEEKFARRMDKKLPYKVIDNVYSEFHYENQQLTGYISKASEVPENKSEPASSLYTRYNYVNRFSEIRDTLREMGLLIYVVMFLGVLAVVTTGSILMLRQFSELSQEQENYALLWKLGASKREVQKLVYLQHSLIYFPPAILSMLHAVFAIYIFSKFVSSSGYLLVYLMGGLLVLIYLIFYILTSVIYLRRVKGENERHF